MSRVCSRCRVDEQKLQEEIARLRGDLANERQHVADMREGVRFGGELAKIVEKVKTLREVSGNVTEGAYSKRAIDLEKEIYADIDRLEKGPQEPRGTVD